MYISWSEVHSRAVADSCENHIYIFLLKIENAPKEALEQAKRREEKSVSTLLFRLKRICTVDKRQQCLSLGFGNCDSAKQL